MSASFQRAIRRECRAISDMLVRKNRAYGDSAANPIRVFARGAPADLLIRVRIDDKLSRITRGNEKDPTEDTVADLIGYLVLLRVVARYRKEKKSGS